MHARAGPLAELGIARTAVFLDVSRRFSTFLDLAAAGRQLVYADEVVVRHLPSGRTAAGPGARRRLITRNSLLTSVMRRPWPPA